jgi:hypothetical protein
MKRILSTITLAALTLGLSVVAATAATAAPATQKIVVRPVHSNGHPVTGYKVSTEKISGFTCDEGSSPVAVDPDISFCGFSATYTVACWKSTNHTALCLRNPLTKALVRIRYQGAFNKVAAPKHPSPEELRLGNSSLCSIRDGGAWGAPKQHPDWIGYDSCAKGAVYGPDTGDGIDRTHAAWTVHVFGGSLKGPGKVETVTKAYYVGTAS